MADRNPYIGPASFSKKDRSRFFGRQAEARDLSDLLIARQAVLLYAQSGAGKTSLLQAKVIPDLRSAGEMHVLRIGRVSGRGEGSNVYLANALLSLKLAGPNLTEALAPVFLHKPCHRKNEEPVPYLLIFDQFEEIFTFRPELADHRREFFEQLRDCLKAYRRLGLLLSMREDFLADMDAFAGYLPDRLRTRMRMERLSDTQAEQAIAEPAAIAGKPFEPGVAKGLVDDLRRVQTTGPAVHALGKYVEPVQLQIVCRQLWQKLPESASTITADHVKTLAKVDDALTGFYHDSLNAVRKELPALSERDLRTWFGSQLITSANTRGMVYRGPTETAGLPNAAVDVLASKYIIRVDLRASWYELAHDRLVEPIVTDNAEWRAAYRNPVADAYERWVAAGSNPDKLLSGNLLTEATGFAATNSAEVSKREREFLDNSITQAGRARRARRLKWIMGAVVLVVVLSLAGIAAWQGEQAKQTLAKLQTFLAQSEIAKGFYNSKEEPDQSLAYFGDALHRVPESAVARIWISTILLDRNRWLPVSSTPPFDADKSLTVTLRADGHAVDISANHVVKATVRDAAAKLAKFSPDGRQLYTAHAGRSSGILWQVTSGSALPAIAPEGLPELVRFTPDGTQLVTRALHTELWDLQKGALVKQLLPGQAYDISADGRYLLAPDSAGFMRRVNIGTGQQDAQIPVTDRAALSANGEYAATFDNGGGVQFWSTASGQRLGKVATDISAKTSESPQPRVAFASTGNRVAIADSKTVTAYDAVTGNPAGKAIALIGPLQDFAISPDGALIATVTSPGLLMVWDSVKGVRTTLPATDASFLVEVKFSPDGKRLLTHAMSDARLWDVESGQPASVEINEEKISDAAWSPDGRQVAIAAHRIHVHSVWIGSSDNSDSSLLADIAGAVGGYSLDANNQPVPLSFDEWIRRLTVLRDRAKEAESNDPAVLFLRTYFGP